MLANEGHLYLSVGRPDTVFEVSSIDGDTLNMTALDPYTWETLRNFWIPIGVLKEQYVFCATDRSVLQNMTALPDPGLMARTISNFANVVERDRDKIDSDAAADLKKTVGTLQSGSFLQHGT